MPSKKERALEAELNKLRPELTQLQTAKDGLARDLLAEQQRTKNEVEIRLIHQLTSDPIHPPTHPPARMHAQVEEKAQALRRCEELGKQLEETKRGADDLRMHSDALEEEADDLRAKCVAATNEAATSKGELAQALSGAADEVTVA